MKHDEQNPQEVSLESIEDRYKSLIGFIPPRAAARLRWMDQRDPEFLRRIEDVRLHGMYPEVFDVTTTQLMLVGILLAQVAEAAKWHIIAARRAGATWEQLNAVANLAFLFRGLPAINLAGKLFEEVEKMEGEREANG